MCLARRRGPKTPSRTTDAHLECVCIIVTHLFSVVPKVGGARSTLPGMELPLLPYLLTEPDMTALESFEILSNLVRK